MEFNIYYSLIGYIICGSAIIHIIFDLNQNRLQRFLVLITLFFYAIFLEYIGITTGNHFYAQDIIMIFEIIPISIPLAWVGIMYSAFIIGERLGLSTWERIISTSLLSLSLDWGMDPIAVKLGLWTWIHEGGNYFDVPSFNFIGWFLIPITYLLSYSLNWNKERKRLELLSINEIDKYDTLSRKLYTIFCVIPISLGLLILFGSINLIPIVYNLPIFLVIILEIFTVISISLILINKREYLKHSYLNELIPPTILLFIAWSYGFLSLFIKEFFLAFLMFLTSIPLFLTFIFTLEKNKDQIRP